MAIVFPASPSVNDTFTEGSITYKWDGDKWIGLGITPADRLVEGSNKLEINASNELVWTGGAASFAGGAAVIASSGNLSINRTTGTNDILNGKLNGSVTSTLNADGLIQLGSASNSTNNNGLYLGGQNGSLNIYTTRYTSDCFQILNTSGSGTNVALRAYGNGDVEIAGTIQTNTKSAGNIELDSSGAFTSPKIKLFAATGAAEFKATVDVTSDTYSYIGRRSSDNTAVFAVADTGLVNVGPVSGNTSNIVLDGSNGSATFAASLVTGNEVYIKGTDATTQRYLNFDRPTAGEYRATLRRDAWYLGETVQNIGNVTPTGANITLKMNGDATFAGNCLFGTTSNGTTVKGIVARSSGELLCSRTNGPALLVNRLGNDGTLIDFRGQNSSEGSISVSGGTISYNGAHLSRWSQLPGNAERIEILRGSVLSNVDEMCEWGDEDNEQLNRMKVSDVEGDVNVAGVFQNWDDDDETYTNDFYCSMTGDFVIRIAQGTTVERGDLLMSAGDGTAKPQDDDIIRSKTIAKVSSTNISETYEDGSYCVPCVLMAC